MACMDMFPHAIVRVGAAWRGAIRPESKWPENPFLSEAASDLDSIHQSVMSVASKLNQDGFAHKLGPRRDRRQAKTFERGRLT